MSSCSTLKMPDINHLKKERFDTLKLVPSWQPNELRIDIIRQTYQENVTDSTTETANTPYHPLGFELGNGLFYDLNKNLCLRVDYLLDFSKDEDYELHEITQPEKNKGLTIYRYLQDSLSVQYSPRKKIQYCYHKINYPDSIAFFYKNLLQFILVASDSTLSFSGKKRKYDVIHKIDSTQFYLNKKKWNQNYKIQNNEIFLENDYIIKRSNHREKIEIIMPLRKRKNNILYTMEKDTSTIYFYDSNNFGLSIQKKENSILIYRNQTLYRKYEIKSWRPISVN